MKDQEFKAQNQSLIAQNQSLNAQFNKAQSELFYSYAHENARFKVGDIIEDTYRQRMLVTKILYAAPTRRREYPTTVYHGKVYTRQMKFRKDGETAQRGDTLHEDLKLVKESLAIKAQRR